MLRDQAETDLSTRLVRQAIRSLLIAVFFVVGAQSASASIWDVFGMSARGTAMGGAQGATAKNHAGVYYNPAMIAERRTTNVSFTAQVLAPDLEIQQGADTTRPAVLPKTNIMATIGAVFPFGGKIDDRLALGVVVHLPLLNFTHYDSHDPATPQFYLYQSLPDSLVIGLALGGRIFDWLSVGVGAQILASFEGSLETRLGLSNRTVSRRELELGVLGEIAPTVGLKIGPFEGFTFGFTWRDDLSLGFSLPIVLGVEELGELPIQADGTGLYSPDQFNFALGYTLPWIDFLVTFDLTWMRWSEAPPPSVQISAELDDSGLDPESPSPLLTLETFNSPLGAEDTFIPRLGLEYAYNDVVAFQGGYFYRATHVPDQKGYTSYADNTAHSLSLGASLTFSNPLEVNESPFGIDGFLQFTFLEERDAAKDPAFDITGTGDYTSRGTVWNAGLEFRQDF